MATDQHRLAEALREADYPATKQQLVDHAEAGQADQGTVQALRSMPPVSYANFEEVLAAVPTPSTGGAGKPDAGKAAPHRQPRKGGVAEQAAPENPIVAELGENRGS